jgi:hypothetical protein
VANLKVTFLGAAETVTGSRYLVETDPGLAAPSWMALTSSRFMANTCACARGSADSKGEPAAADAFRRRLRDAFGWDVQVPEMGTTVDPAKEPRTA